MSLLNATPQPRHGSHRRQDAFYAPDVPDTARAYRSYFTEHRKARIRRRLGDRIIPAEVISQVHRDPAGLRGNLYNQLHATYEQARRTALPLSGVVDLAEYEHRLARELWACAQLLRDLAFVRHTGYDTSAAEEILIAAFDERMADMRGLEAENRQLYKETGAEPTVVPEPVRQALERAGAAADDRPARDAALFTRSLRELLRG